MTGSSKNLWWGIAYGVLCGLLATGIILLVSRTPRGEAIELRPPPSPQPILVDVTGAVIQPGVYSLPYGSRVVDAIEAAGGLTDDALTRSLNLASILEDGQKVWVPQVTATPLPGTPPDVRASGVEILVNINTSSQSQLEELPEIGPVTALAIIAYRETNGPFLKIEDIQKVDGIGTVTFEKIKDLITVGE
jgi:competence protein ComEA